MWPGGMHGRGHVWQRACVVGACMAGGVCVACNLKTRIRRSELANVVSCLTSTKHNRTFFQLFPPGDDI